MQKIAILTDSTSCIDFLPHQYENIFQVRLTVSFTQEEFIDGETITPDEFYTRIATDPVVPKTSQPAVGHLVEVIKHIQSLGYTDIIYLPISKALSGTYQAGLLAKDLVSDINIHLLDSKLTASFLGYLVLNAANLVALGDDVQTICKKCQTLIDESHIYFFIKDIKYLVKNGRLSNASGFFGSLLQVVPIIEFTKDGEIKAVEKTRTIKKATTEVIKRLHTEIETKKKVQFFVCHTNDLDLLEHTKAELSTVIDLESVIFTPIPPVLGAHVGPSAIGLGYFILEH